MITKDDLTAEERLDLKLLLDDGYNEQDILREIEAGRGETGETNDSTAEELEIIEPEPEPQEPEKPNPTTYGMRVPKGMYPTMEDAS